MDAVATLEAVVQLAKERQAFGRVLTSVRRVDESDEATLLRLVAERAVVVGMMKHYKVPTEPFDFEYKQNFQSAFEELLRPVDAAVRLKGER